MDPMCSASARRTETIRRRFSRISVTRSEYGLREHRSKVATIRATAPIARKTAQASPHPMRAEWRPSFGPCIRTGSQSTFHGSLLPRAITSSIQPIGRLTGAKALSTPLVPGLVVSSYSLDGVVSDSLKANHTYDLKVTFKNVMGAGTKLSAVATSELGAKLVTVSGSLGSMAESATATGDFQITRNGVFSSGDYPVRFAVTDGALYSDTLTLYIPLSVVPGFVLERGGVYGSSVTRVSNTAAWAAFGQASSNGQIYNAEFANEQG